MSISSVKTGEVGTSLLVGNYKFLPPTFESIASYVASGSETNVGFSSIPSTYSSLHIRIIQGQTGPGGSVFMTFNGDSGSNYARHSFAGNGTDLYYGSATSTTALFAASDSGTSNTYFQGYLIDIPDYASTAKNKTVKILEGYDKGATGWIQMISGLWMNTSAINTINFSISQGNFCSGSRFSLYGIKGAY